MSNEEYPNFKIQLQYLSRTKRYWDGNLFHNNLTGAALQRLDRRGQIDFDQVYIYNFAAFACNVGLPISVEVKFWPETLMMKVTPTVSGVPMYCANHGSGQYDEHAYKFNWLSIKKQQITSKQVHTEFERCAAVKADFIDIDAHYDVATLDTSDVAMMDIAHAKARQKVQEIMESLDEWLSPDSRMNLKNLSKIYNINKAKGGE